MTDHLSDTQLCLLFLGIMAMGLAGLMTVIVWPIDAPRVDRGGGFYVADDDVIVATRCGNEDLKNCRPLGLPSGGRREGDGGAGPACKRLAAVPRLAAHSDFLGRAL